MTKKIGIIGGGNVGSALNKGLTAAGYETRVSDETNVRDVAIGADVIILAVPFTAIDAVISSAGDAFDGKLIVDVTNTLDAKMGFAAQASSGAEELQKKLPRAKVTKAFNTVFAQHMSAGRLRGEALTAFVAGDDEAARNQVLKLAKDIGFDSLSAGPLANARHLEAFGYLNIQLGYVLGHGAMTGFQYIRST
ncbi:MAG TPA: NAD(P)-binding domain-containing protein [Pseudobdellovibrionaceae bacterium]|nr:NAD(P)-binding domain-containing protein [Pseudobdellovibrionaceae bacterium]